MDNQYDFVSRLRLDLVEGIEQRRGNKRAKLADQIRGNHPSCRFVGILVASVLVVSGVVFPVLQLSGVTLSSAEAKPAAAQPVPTASIQLPRGVTAIVTGYSGVWASTLSGSVVRIDPSTNQIAATIPVSGIGDFSRLAAGAGNIWVTHSGSVARIDPATNRVTADIGVGGTLLGIAASDSAVWVTTQGTSGSELVTIDPATNHPSGQPISLPDGATDLAYLQGKLWVDISLYGGSVVSVDPSSGKVSSAPEASIPEAAFANSLWAPAWTGVDRIDPATNAVVAEIPLARVVQTGAGLDGVWALTATGSTSSTLYEPDQSRPATLVLLDPATNSVVGTPVSVGISPAYMAVGDGAVWVAQYDSGIVTRVDLAG
jgi:DNA-binding beta-propeller fold protein YncE